VHSDPLGSTRLETDSAGAPTRCYDYLPFGEEIGNGVAGRTGPCFGAYQYPSTPDALSIKFTSKERDAETGLDFFESRNYSGTQGRFTSPDRFNIVTDAESREQFNSFLMQPQNWNKYAYTWNNPLRYTDPTGEVVELLGDEDARKKELALLQSAVGSKAASSLYINAVKDRDNTRYLVGIKGDLGDFMKLGDPAHSLANLVANKSVVEFGFQSRDCHLARVRARVGVYQRQTAVADKLRSTRLGEPDARAFLRTAWSVQRPSHTALRKAQWPSTDYRRCSWFHGWC
jgi:RHS repeat-associated protein